MSFMSCSNASNLIQDSHFHLSLKIDTETSIKLPSSGKHFCNSTSTADIPIVNSIAQNNPCILPFFGIHPWSASRVSGKIENTIAALISVIESTPESGIGECGLDFSQQYRNSREKQILLFQRQIKLAADFKRPLCIHCVRAFGDLFSSLRPIANTPLPFIIHSFYGSTETAERLIKLGAYISLSAKSLINPFKSYNTIRSIPVEKLLIESDLTIDGSDESAKRHFTELDNNYKIVSDILGISKLKLIEQVIDNGKIFTNRKTSGQ